MTPTPASRTPPPPPTPPFEWSVADGVGTLTLSRPDVLNALTFEVYAALARRLYDLRQDDAVRAVVLTGKGRGFCSGGDVDAIIGALFEGDTKDVLEFTRLTGEVIENLRRLDKPVVAALNGVAAGAGAVIALACDLRVMADTAKFAFLFTKVGLAGADMGAAYLLPRVVGLGRATELLLLGDPVDAETALRIGLATRVVPKDKVLEEATALARRLADGPTPRARHDEAAARPRGVDGPRARPSSSRPSRRRSSCARRTTATSTTRTRRGSRRASKGGRRVASDHATRYGLTSEEEDWRRAGRDVRARRGRAARRARADREGRFPQELVPRMGALGPARGPAAAVARGRGRGRARERPDLGGDRPRGRQRPRLPRGPRGPRGADGREVRDGARSAPTGCPGSPRGPTSAASASPSPTRAATSRPSRRRAVEDGDDVVIDGEKHWITNGGIADLAHRVRHGRAGRGPQGHRGLPRPHVHARLRGAPDGGARARAPRERPRARGLPRVRVPRSNAARPRARRASASPWPASTTGASAWPRAPSASRRRASTLATAFARSRRQFGQRIGDFQQVGALSSPTCASTLEASRLLVHHAGRRIDAGHEATAETSAAKLFATEAALRAATQAVRIHGARGYSDELPLERHYRDAIGLTIYEGTSEIQRVILARDLLGQGRGGGPG